ncbi:MAG TPA: DUF6788 family protein [Chthoniobacterales bacterium]|nr:DUF6788 family protein [Chthoniobacterales bacterium]
MKNPPLTALKIQHLKERYHLLSSKLASFETLSQGSVLPQLPKAWRWTRKVRGKTVTLGLTPGKAQKMKQAIANHRAMDKIIDEMREISQKLILETPENTQVFELENHPKTPLT